MQILKNIQQLLPILACEEQILANFILSHTLDVRSYSQTELLVKSNCTETILASLLSKLDCPDFNEFKKEFHPVSADFKLNLNVQNLLQDCLDMQIENLKATYTNLTTPLVTEALVKIHKAKRIYIIGMRSSFSLAYTLHHCLTQLLGNCELVTDSKGGLLDKVLDIGEQDLLIAICLPRYSNYTVELFKTLKETRQVQTIAITDSANSPLIKHADLLLPCYYNSLSFHNSLTGAVFLLDFLITAVAASLPVKTKLRLSEAECLLQKAKQHKPS